MKSQIQFLASIVIIYYLNTTIGFLKPSSFLTISLRRQLLFDNKKNSWRYAKKPPPSKQRNSILPPDSEEDVAEQFLKYFGRKEEPPSMLRKETLKLIDEEVKKNLKWNESAYLDALIKNDVYRTENYWETVNPKYVNRRREAMLKGDMNKVKEIDTNYGELMRLGFQKRLLFESSDLDLDNPEELENNVHGIGHTLVRRAMGVQEDPNVLLKKFQEKNVAERKGLIKYLHPDLLPYYDYFLSLFYKPTLYDIQFPVAVFVLLSMLTLFANPMFSFAFPFVGLVGLMITLLTRNMPKIQENKDEPDYFPTSAVSFSEISIRTTIAIVTPIFAISWLLASIKLNKNLSGVVAMGITAFLTSFFEVYENGSDTGSRWCKATERYSKKAVTAFISDLQNKTRAIDDDEEILNYDPEEEARIKYDMRIQQAQKEVDAIVKKEDKEAFQDYKDWLEEMKPTKFLKLDDPDLTDEIGVEKDFFDTEYFFDPEDKELKEIADAGYKPIPNLEKKTHVTFRNQRSSY